MYLTLGITVGWISLFLLVIGFRDITLRSTGYIVLGACMFTLIPYTFTTDRIIQAVGLVAGGMLSVYIGRKLLERRLQMIQTTRIIVAVLSIFLLVYSFDSIQNYLIHRTARDTEYLISIVGYEADTVLTDTGQYIKFNRMGRETQIVTACSGIGTIAIFSGMILTVRNISIGHRILLLLSVSSLIYLVNAIRNTFIAITYGDQLLHIAPNIVGAIFGRDDEWVSYYIADQIISQLGAVVFIGFLGYFIITRYSVGIIDEWAEISKLLS